MGEGSLQPPIRSQGSEGGPTLEVLCPKSSWGPVHRAFTSTALQCRDEPETPSSKEKTLGSLFRKRGACVITVLKA